MKAFLISMLLALASPASMTQGASAAPPSPDHVVPLTAGQSVVALNGPWKFHIGDSSTWAEPDFDDSNWEQYVLVPGARSLTPEQAFELPELPGWQHHGHPRYSGYAWYRIRLEIEPGSRSLALLMPKNVEHAYEIYLNGRLIGRLGKLDGFHLTYRPRPNLFRLPADGASNGQPVTLAIRFWSMPWGGLPRRPAVYGGLRGVPLLGSPGLLEIFRRSSTEPLVVGNVIVLALYAAVGLISLFLFWFSREQPEYLWAGVALLGWGLVSGASLAGQVQQSAFSYQLIIFTQMAAGSITTFSIPMAGMYLLGVPRMRWRRASYIGFFLNIALGVESLGIIYGYIPANETFERIDAVLWWMPSAALTVVILLIAIDAIRKIGNEVWLLMCPGILYGASRFLFLLTSRYPEFLAHFGVLQAGFTATHIVTASAPVSLLIIFLIRFTRQQRENGRMVEDMRQAREVQRFLIPEKMPQVSGWIIESEYLPAREVGGDFFQIIPDSHDGSLLIVAGDVTGKGLQAGMLVAMLVGAIRTESTHTSAPARILSVLNSRLHGREPAQATCLALQIAADGTAILANAGHLPPYLNGEPIEIEGSLPLGAIETAQPSVVEFQLKLNDRLVLVSDGIVEATNANGTLFGFERLQALLRNAQSAGEVASAAQRFGQEDDISVISITNKGAAEPAHPQPIRMIAESLIQSNPLVAGE